MKSPLPPFCQVEPAIFISEPLHLPIKSFYNYTKKSIGKVSTKRPFFSTKRQDRERDRQTERKRETERERERQKEKDRDRDGERETDRDRDRGRDRQEDTDRQR